jgi:hypothetical protein
MYGFFIKKAFFDGWDNLFSLVLMNAGFILISSAGLLLPQALGAAPALGLVAAALALVAGAIWWSACVVGLKPVADFGAFRLADLGGALKAGLVPGLQAGGILAAAFVLLSVGLPFYMSRWGLAGAFAAGILFWCAVVLFVALQYYIPVRARFGGGFRKNLRKCLILFFDNPLFSVFLFLYNTATLVVSFPLAFLLPGPAGMALALDVALRFFERKYDWTEANPGADRRKVPWMDILEEDRELVGKRTLKGMIFPWKE